ncbi:MAG: hypothetical protein MHM6MM_007266 [Cercozoa sp. M6MM]
MQRFALSQLTLLRQRNSLHPAQLVLRWRCDPTSVDGVVRPVSLGVLSDALHFVCSNLHAKTVEETASAALQLLRASFRVADFEDDVSLKLESTKGDFEDFCLSDDERRRVFSQALQFENRALHAKFRAVELFRAEDGSCSMARLDLPRESGLIPFHLHRAMQECEMSLGFNLKLLTRNQLRTVPPGETVQWPHELAHQWSGEGSLLCMNSPAFDADDECQIDSENSFDDSELRESWSQRNVSLLSGATFEFPGAFSEQEIVLRFASELGVLNHESTEFEDAHSALCIVVCRDTRRFLAVQHRRRGWEVPGGKVDPGETAREAARRELHEEAGAVLTSQQLLELRPLAQYTIVDSDDVHRKTAYLLMVGGSDDVRLQAVTRETSSARWYLQFLRILYVAYCVQVAT